MLQPRRLILRRRSRRGLVAALAAAMAAAALALQPAASDAQQDADGPPDGYYRAAEGMSGETLRRALHDIIDDHEVTSFSSPESRRNIARLEAHPTETGKVLTFYGNEPRYADSAAHATGWHREHLWPDSYGFDNEVYGEGRSNVPLGDLHALVAASPPYNLSRGNAVFGLCRRNCVAKPVHGHPDDPNRRQPGEDGAPAVWEVWRERRGDAARAVFYMDVRYAGDRSAADGHAHEPDLVLTDVMRLGDTVSQAHGYMADLPDLMAWHHEDPVDDREARRNALVYEIQGNRNPFIDRPELVDALWSPTPMASRYPIHLPHVHRSGRAIEMMGTPRAPEGAPIGAYGDARLQDAVQDS